VDVDVDDDVELVDVDVDVDDDVALVLTGGVTAVVAVASGKVGGVTGGRGVPDGARAAGVVDLGGTMGGDAVVVGSGVVVLDVVVLDVVVLDVVVLESAGGGGGGTAPEAGSGDNVSAPPPSSAVTAAGAGGPTEGAASSSPDAATKASAANAAAAATTTPITTDNCWGPKRGFAGGTTTAAAAAAAAATAEATCARSPAGTPTVLTLDSALTTSGASQRERTAPTSDAGGVAPATAPSSRFESSCSNGVRPASLTARPASSAPASAAIPPRPGPWQSRR
jgi:hypothetical protein